MRISKIFNRFRAPENRVHFTSAIIVAGGSGLRVGADKPKQHLLLCGVEVVVHSMLAFEKCDKIDEIIVVCKAGEEGIYDGYKQKYNITKMARAVAGGDTRQASVMNGFEACDKKCEFVAIHDAARCLITPEAITEVVKSAYKYRAATAASAAVDTVKIVDDKGFIVKSPDRRTVYLASTPQVFKRDIYETCAYSAKKDGFEVTDDNSLVERMGFKVKVCPDKTANVKLTRPDDLPMMEAIIKNRK